MPVAFTLIRTESGKEIEVLNALLEQEMVKFAFILLGRFDIIVRIHADKMEDIRSVIFNVIRKLPYIVDTTTLVAAEGKDKSYSPMAL
jgi:DNA-binding Lrp family transcriptional regulator